MIIIERDENGGIIVGGEPLAGEPTRPSVTLTTEQIETQQRSIETADLEEKASARSNLVAALDSGDSARIADALLGSVPDVDSPPVIIEEPPVIDVPDVPVIEDPVIDVRER